MRITYITTIAVAVTLSLAAIACETQVKTSRVDKSEMDNSFELTTAQGIPQTKEINEIQGTKSTEDILRVSTSTTVNEGRRNKTGSSISSIPTLKSTTTSESVTNNIQGTSQNAQNGGYPSEESTGVPEGTALDPSGSIVVSTPGAVIEGLDIRGTVTINASNVTLKRSRIRGSGFAIVRIKDGVTGVVIEDVEIDGQGFSGTSNSMGVIGRATVIRSNIHGVENGVTPYSGSVLRGNFIHDLAAPGAPHYDGVQIDGGANIVIDHNTIDLSEHSQTATIMIDNYFGPISNVTVKNNFLLGGGYTVYSDAQFDGGPISGVSFVDNQFQKGFWGYASINGNDPVWSGNTDPNGNSISR